MCKISEFDGGMIYCMKTILSYYEVKRDRILSDYLFLICIPMMVNHCYTISPDETITYYYNYFR